jgi:hypothetical protein
LVQILSVRYIRLLKYYQHFHLLSGYRNKITVCYGLFILTFLFNRLCHVVLVLENQLLFFSAVTRTLRPTFSILNFFCCLSSFMTEIMISRKQWYLGCYCFKQCNFILAKNRENNYNLQRFRRETVYIA